MVLVYVCAVMIGWIIHDPFLVRIKSGFVPMTFNTAFLLAILSLGILFSEYRFFKIGRLCSIVVMLFAAVVNMQYPLDTNWGIDTFFTTPFIRSNSIYPGRMAASVTVTLMLLGLALFFNRKTILCQYVRSVAATCAFGFGLVGLLGYVFGFNAEYGWGSFARMAMQTAVCFILLAMALLFQLRLKVKEESPARGYFMPFYILSIGVLLSLLIWQLLVVKDYEKSRRITEIRAEALKSQLDNTFYPLETSLQNMARRFALGKYRNYEMWALDSEGYIDDFGGLKRVTWADKNFVTQWVYPLSNEGQRLLKMNIRTEPDVRDVVEHVLKTHQSSLSGTFELKSGGRGFVLFTPIYREDVFLGMITTAIVAKPFFERVAQVPGYELTILENGSELISNVKSDDSFTREWTHRTKYRSLNANWEIVLTPSRAIVRDNASVLPAFVLIFGITISVLLSLALKFYLKAIEAERKVRENLEWQNAARDSISLLLLTTTADIKIRDVNTALERVLEYSYDELIGKDPYFFHDHEEAMSNRGRMESILGRRLDSTKAYAEAMFELGYNKASERTLIAKSGRRINVVASVSQVRNEKGQVDGYMAIFEDVTEKKERENLLKEQEKRIMTTSRLASLGEMAAGIAHEINNPLAIISGYVSVLRKNLSQKGMDNEPEIIRRVDAIDSTVQRMAKIIRGLRSYSRESHDGDDEVVGLDSIIDDTLAFCHEKFRNEGVELVARIEPNLKVKCRPYQISQVILNLLNNAFDAVGESAHRRVQLEARHFEGGIEISVVDSGPGVPRDLREKIMQPFFTTKEVGKGVGLGLSISQGIIQGHGGKFYLDENSKQTRFVIWLPA